MRKKSKKKYTKKCKADITKEMWYILAVMKSTLGKSKAQIIREALQEYYENHISEGA